MKVSEFQAIFKSSLTSHYSEGELRQLLFMVLEEVCNYTRIDVGIKQNDFLDTNQLVKLNNTLTKLKLGVPIQYIHGFVPLSEMFGYATTIRSLSQGRASYSMEPSHYEEVPRNLTEELVATAKA